MPIRSQRARGRAPTRRAEAVRVRTTRVPSPRAAADNALAVLTADHARVLELFGRVAKLKSNGPQKAQLVERICDELELHARVEEELLYPSAREVIGDAELMDEAAVEHDSAKALIDQLRGMKPGDDRYDATVSVLGEYVRHHVNEEQDVMFPKVRATDLDLVALGRAIKTRKRRIKGESRAQNLLGLAAFPGVMIP
jgi:hemerythrin superfamily protein